VKMIPTIPSGDFDVTETFHRALGFDEAGRWPNEYLILQRLTDRLECTFVQTEGRSDRERCRVLRSVRQRPRSTVPLRGMGTCRCQSRSSTPTGSARTVVDQGSMCCR
jgi:hypothetical protein